MKIVRALLSQEIEAGSVVCVDTNTSSTFGLESGDESHTTVIHVY